MGGSHIQILPDTTNPKAHRFYRADGAVMHSEYAHVRSTPNSWFKAAIAAGNEVSCNGSSYLRQRQLRCGRITLCECGHNYY